MSLGRGSHRHSGRLTSACSGPDQHSRANRSGRACRTCLCERRSELGCVWDSQGYVVLCMCGECDHICLGVCAWVCVSLDICTCVSENIRHYTELVCVCVCPFSTHFSPVTSVRTAGGGTEAEMIQEVLLAPPPHSALQVMEGTLMPVGSGRARLWPGYTAGRG